MPLGWFRKESKEERFAQHREAWLPSRNILCLHGCSGRRDLLAAELLRKSGYDVRALKAGVDDPGRAGFWVET